MDSRRVELLMPRFFTLLLALIVLTVPLFAQRRGGPGTGNPDEHLVPWKFQPAGGDLGGGPVVLYWLPSSQDEIKRSPLLTSRALMDVISRCVGFEIVTPDDARSIEKLGATGKLPMAVITDDKGHVVRSVGAVRGGLSASAVEEMLTAELRARDDAVYVALTEANRAASANDNAKAIALYQDIWRDRCLYPLVGREAQRSLAKLGVLVHETPAPILPDPNLSVTKKPEPKKATH
jgi:hypothetical protein